MDYEDDEDDLTTLEAGVSSALSRHSTSKQLVTTPNLLSSPRLSNRQVPPSIPPQRPFPDDDDEDNLLESLVRPKERSPSPSAGPKKSPGLERTPMRPMGKRQREDEDDELLERLASKAKRPDLGAEKVLAGAGIRAGSKLGDDPPKKIKLKFGLTSLGADPSATPSEPGAKNGDTG